MTNTHPPFVLYVGATWQFDAALHDAACNPLDLAGAAVEWRLYDRGGAQRIVLTIGTGVTITDTANGLCQIVVPPLETGKLSPGYFRDEIRATLPTGFITVQAVGDINVAKAGASAAPPDLPAQLAALKTARRSGVRRTRIEGFEVEYADDAELSAAITSLEREIAAAQGVAPVRSVYLRSKGWS